MSNDIISLSDILSRRLKGVDCIVAFESAADSLGICCPAIERPAIYVYSCEEISIDGIECTIVDSYDGIDIIELGGIRYTSPAQTIFDLLRYDRDDQVILESLADWYYEHDESFDDLQVPDDLKSVFEDYREDAINYYNY